ncbi:putative aminohydrolase SsnA [Collinsella tanakaei]|nr:putative aminohydrolase SsnA [Collinsella tanakaei]
MLIVGNGSVVTRDVEKPYLERGAVLIDGDTIVAVGAEDELVAANPGAEYVDAHGGIIMPGLINAHTHIYSGLARGLAIKGCDPKNFLDNLEMQWWKIDDNLYMDGTRASAYATVLDSIRDGVTTIFDHHASFAEIPGSLFAIKDVCEETGMRACLCYETSDRRGEAKRDQSIAENAEFARWAADARERGNHMIAAMFGGHATFTLSDETMDKMAEANDGLTGFHIHVCEGMNDVWDSRQNRGGISPVERLLQHNLLGPDTMLGHCIHVTPAEMDIIKESGTWIVNNPESNMGNAVGCAPVLEFFRRGIPVCMGTDAYTHDMLESLKVFLIIQRHNAAMPNVGWGEAMTMLFDNNARMASKYFGRELGVLKPGAAADVIVMDYKKFTPLSEENIDGHMLFGMMGKNCRTTIINGKVLYKDREFVAFDEDRINAWTMEQSKKLWGDLNGRTY